MSRGTVSVDGCCPGGWCLWTGGVAVGGVPGWMLSRGTVSPKGMAARPPSSRVAARGRAVPCRPGAAEAPHRGGPPRARRYPGFTVRRPRRSPPLRLPAAAARWRPCAWEGAAGPDGAAGAGGGRSRRRRRRGGVPGCARGVAAPAAPAAHRPDGACAAAAPAGHSPPAAAPARRYRPAGSRGGLPQGRAGTRGGTLLTSGLGPGCGGETACLEVCSRKAPS